MAPEAATADVDAAAAADAMGQATDTPTKGEYDDLPDPLVETGITPKPDEQKTEGDDDGKTGDGSSDDAGALELTPRQQEAAERLHLSAEDLKAQVDALGAEKVVAMLDAASPDEGAGDDDEKEKTGADEGEGFRFADDLRDVYEEHGDLLDATEGAINGLRGEMNTVAAESRALLFTMAARMAIEKAGDVAKELTPDKVLEKADQLAGASALQGKRLEPFAAIDQAMQTLTSGNATAAARAGIKKTLGDRAKQMTGAPAGRTKAQPTGAAAEKQRALDAIEQARIDAGLPPS